MRRGNAKLYKPEAAIGRPRFKAIKTPIAVREWRCELCGEIIPIGRHYLRYFDRRPLEIDDCPYHFMCWAVINAYCIQNRKQRYVNGWVMNWARKTFCTDCKADCTGFHNCERIATAIRYEPPVYPFDEPEK